MIFILLYKDRGNIIWVILEELDNYLDLYDVMFDWFGNYSGYGNEEGIEYFVYCNLDM